MSFAVLRSWFFGLPEEARHLVGGVALALAGLLIVFCFQILSVASQSWSQIDRSAPRIALSRRSAPDPGVKTALVTLWGRFVGLEHRSTPMHR